METKFLNQTNAGLIAYKQEVQAVLKESTDLIADQDIQINALKAFVIEMQSALDETQKVLTSFRDELAEAVSAQTRAKYFALAYASIAALEFLYIIWKTLHV